MPKFKNTFAPLITNEELSVDNVIRGLNLGFIQYTELPTEVREAIDTEMQKRTK